MRRNSRTVGRKGRNKTSVGIPNTGRTDSKKGKGKIMK